MTTTLAEILTTHYAPLRRLSPKTITRYENTLKMFGRWLAKDESRSPGPPRLDDLTDLVVARYIAAREQERCIVTARIDRNKLLALWRYCARKRLVDQFPELPPMPVPEKVPRAYTTADLDALLDYFGRLRPWRKVAGVPASEWWCSLLRTLFETGCRITETLSVEWPDVDLESRTILVRAENRKGRTRDIIREISPETVEMLAARRRPSGPVWPWTMHKLYIWSRFKRHCGKAGVTYRKGFHAIRKASCSYTAAAGGDATALADHADASTTRSYLDPSIVKPESNLARLPRLGVADDSQEPPAEERAIRTGFQAGKALAVAGMARPDRITAMTLAAAAGFASTGAALYWHGMVIGWESARGDEGPALSVVG